jgi:DNA repair protein RecO (recombination protein O)
MLVTTEAVVLKSMKFRDSSKIVTLYTREFGRTSVLAKGARGPKSRFGSSLEPMSYVTAILYRKESRSLQLLSRCESLRPLRSLTEDLRKMAAAMSMLELMNAVSHEEEKNPELFELLVGCLLSLNAATKGYRNTLYFFEVRLLDLLGFRPNFVTCAGCGKELEGAGGTQIGIQALQGGAFCHDCTGQGRGLETYSNGTLSILRRMQDLADPEGATRIVMDATRESEVGTAVRHLLETHVEAIRTLKSEGVFASIL